MALRAARCTLMKLSVMRRCAAAAPPAAVASMDMIKDLRHRTEAGVLDCKQALAASGNDMEKAVEWLKKKGVAKADKKSDRETSYGVLMAIPTSKGTAAIVQLCTETPFAAKSDTFIDMAEALRKKMLPTADACAAEAMEKHTSAITSGLSVEFVAASLRSEFKDDITLCASRISENIQLKNAWLLPLPPFAPNLKIPEHLRQTPVSRVTGCYAHNSFPQAPLIGSMISAVSLFRMAGGAAAAAATPDDGCTPFHTLADDNAAVASASTDFAQHVLANAGETDKITHQAFLGSEETAGKWLQRHRMTFASSLFVSFGTPKGVVFPPPPPS